MSQYFPKPYEPFGLTKNSDIDKYTYSEYAMDCVEKESFQ